MIRGSWFLALWLVATGCGEGTADAPSGNQALADALGDYRPFPLRLTGGFPHRPCPGTARPLCDSLPANQPRVTAALDRLNLEIRRARIATRGAGHDSSSHREAVWKLVLRHDLPGIDAAIATLEQAVAEDPQNADFHNDLAVAYGARSEMDERYHGYYRFQAQAAAADAVHHDPDHPEALFNLALLQAEMGLRSTAAETWRRFREVEPDPGWRAEAEEHLAMAEAPREIDSWSGEALEAAAEAGDEAEVRRLVQLSPIQARTQLQRALFPAWGGAYLAGDFEAAGAARAKLAVIVPILTAEIRDWEAADNLALIEADPGNPEANRRRGALAEGLAGLGELQYLPQGCPPERYQRLEAARDALTEAGGGSVGWAGWGLGVCHQLMGQLDPAIVILQEAAGQTDPARYPIGAAYLLRQWALDAEFADGFNQALQIYPLAIQLSTAEPATAHSIKMLHCSLLQHLGLERDAWSLRYELLQQLEQLPWNNATAGLLAETASFLRDAGHPVAALPYQDQEVAHKAESDIPSWQAYAYGFRARILEGSGDWNRAAEDIATAHEYARQEPDAQRRARLLRFLSEIEARLLLEVDPEAATEKLVLAEEQARNSGEPETLADTLLLAAELHRHRGEMAAVEDRLREALTLKEGIYREIQNPRARRIALARLWPQVRDLVILLVEEQGAYEEAFEFADAARSRAFLEEIGAPPPLSIAQLAVQIPADTALVHYLSAEPATFCWVLTSDGLQFFRLDLTAARTRVLEEAVRSTLGASPPAPVEDTIALLLELYDRLLRPIAPALDSVERVVFVPFDGLEGIPFAALVDRDTGRYLVQDIIPSRANGASIAVALAERHRSRGAWQPDSVLTVGNPAFNTTLYPFLETLPAAVEEAQEIAQLYAAEPPLLGPDATVEPLRARLASADLFHFAGHALAGLEPALLLASHDGDPSGTLLASALEDLSMPRLRLVVLSACETAAAGEAADTEGLVRPFLAAGADGVVASLWKVGDNPTRVLMERFHQQLRLGVSAHEALTYAQRSMLTETESIYEAPSTWAAFSFFGFWGGKYGQVDNQDGRAVRDGPRQTLSHGQKQRALGSAHRCQESPPDAAQSFPGISFWHAPTGLEARRRAYRSQNIARG